MEKNEQRTRNQPLEFKPLTDGLGFHPFSDGLPYAPLSRAPQTQNPSGATAAGPAMIARQLPRIAPSSIAPTPHAHASPAPAPQASAQKVPSHPAIPEETLGLVYLARRLFAWLLDSSLHISLCLGVLWIGLESQGVRVDAILRSEAWVAAAVFVLGFNWALTLAQEIAFHTTTGKRVFGLMIEGSPSALFIRAFFFVPSLLFAGVGLLWSLFDSERRCWHDRVVDLQPRPIASL